MRSDDGDGSSDSDDAASEENALVRLQPAGLIVILHYSTVMCSQDGAEQISHSRWIMIQYIDLNSDCTKACLYIGRPENSHSGLGLIGYA